MKKLVLTLSVLGCFNVVADSSIVSAWQDFGQNSRSISNLLSPNENLKKRSFLLDETLLNNHLSSLSNRSTAAKGMISKLPSAEIELPLPDGSMLKVNATPSQVITQSMAEAHPEIKTWNVSGINDPDIKGVIDFTSNGFHGMLMMPDGDTIFIDPDKNYAGDVYNSFSKKENIDSFDEKLNCGAHEDHKLHFEKHLAEPEFAIKKSARALDDSSFPNVSISQVKTYRLALSATAEYTDSQGGTAAARASMVTSVNRINPIFTRDLGVSLQLIDAPELIFTDSKSDPFSNPDNPNTLMRENGDYLSDQGKLDEFDIGHVVSGSSFSGGSGVAFLGVACLGDLNTSNLGLIKGLKAAGATTSSSPSGSTFDLVLLAHELGHQLGANHSFNSSEGANCSNGRSGEVAVEPGSGSSIMAYTGLCGSDNLIEDPRDDYFHFASITQINNYTRSGSGSSCGTNSNISVPTATAGADLKVPANTPFLLDGSASGGSSSWDQIDSGSASAVDVDTGDNAIIRHNIPTSEQDRYIPSLANLFAGTRTKGEILPTTTRELNFAYVVRDGGVNSDKKLINVTDTNNAFSVLSQSSTQTFSHNQNINVNWEVAGTDQAPISCSSVDIQLIRESGVKDMLLASTPNDGSQSLVIHDKTPIMTSARIFVGCSDNSFFNISSGNISIQAGVKTDDTTDPVITIQGNNPLNVGQGTSYIDPGATAVDNEDGNIAVTSTGNVNTNEIGTYTVTYTVTDAAGNNATAIRTVNVTAAADTTPPVITVNGDNNVYITQGQSYSDAGAVANDNVDGTIAVTSSGNVNANVVGTYTINYSSTDTAGNTATATRTINVTAAADTTPPVITMNGDNNVYITQGESYNDAGAVANDNVDGTIAVASSGNVNTDVIGTYTINYSSTDTAGNTATATRTINVTASTEPTPTEPTPTEPTPIEPILVDPIPEDTTPPVITLTVDEEITLQVGQEFVEPEFSANDDRDGSTLVTVEGLDKVDTSKPGEYIITYTSEDASGNITVVKRTVVVTEDSGQNPGNQLTGESSGGGGSFGYLILPLLVLLGLRRPKPVPVRVKKD